MRKRFFLPLALSSFVLVTACNTTGSTIDGGTSMSSEPSAMDFSSSFSSPEAMTAESSSDSSAAASVDSGAEARVIDMTVTDWEFNPASVSVAQGEKVTLRITGVEGKHSFAIADLGINVPIEPGETKDIEIPTGKAGTYQFRCRIPCGPGHKDMVGTLVIS